MASEGEGSGTAAVGDGAASSRGVGRGWLVGGAVLVVALVAVIVIQFRPQNQADVVIVGDSVTFLSAPSIIERLDGRRDLVFRATPGYRSSDLIEPFEEAIQGQRDGGKALTDAVIIVGYNDVLRHDTDFTGLDPMMALAQEFDCAVWFQLPATPGGEPAGDPDLEPAEVERWNARVAKLAEGHPEVHVVSSWADAVNAAPADALLDTDGVHPTAPGQAVLAELVDRALVEQCDA